MNTIPLADIIIAENRQRREFDADAQQEMIESIQSNGLLQAIVLRQEGGGLVLVAGERRIRAISELSELQGLPYRHDGFEVQPGHIPYVNLGELSPLAAEEAELEENIRRVDLTWQERAAAEKRLYELRSKQLGAPAQFAAVALEARGVATPATTSAVKTSVILASNMHRPEVKAAKSAGEAMKILARAEATEKNAEKAAAMGKEFLGGKHKVLNEDCLFAMMNLIGGERFDVIITDPPYAMGADEFGDSGGGAEGAHFYKDDQNVWENVVLPGLALASSLTQPNAHLYIFCDIDRFHDLRQQATKWGWTPFRTPLIWYKPSAFRAPWPEKGPQRKYECILYAVRGDLKCTKLGGDVLTYAPDENLGHQAQKPVALYTDLLSRSVRAGMKVLDPFAGTGPVLPAAHSLSAIAVAIEKDPAAYAIAAGRAASLKEGK